MCSEISEDAKESLEVASQCLQTAYGVSSEDKHLAVAKSLPIIFSESTKSEPVFYYSSLIKIQKLDVSSHIEKIRLRP